MISCRRQYRTLHYPTFPQQVAPTPQLHSRGPTVTGHPAAGSGSRPSPNERGAMGTIPCVHNGLVDASQGSFLPAVASSQSMQVRMSMPPPRQDAAPFVNAAGEKHHESQQSVADAMLDSYQMYKDIRVRSTSMQAPGAAGGWSTLRQDAAERWQLHQNSRAGGHGMLGQAWPANMHSERGPTINVAQEGDGMSILSSPADARPPTSWGGSSSSALSAASRWVHLHGSVNSAGDSRPSGLQSIVPPPPVDTAVAGGIPVSAITVPVGQDLRGMRGASPRGGTVQQDEGVLGYESSEDVAKTLASMSSPSQSGRYSRGSSRGNRRGRFVAASRRASLAEMQQSPLAGAVRGFEAPQTGQSFPPASWSLTSGSAHQTDDSKRRSSSRYDSETNPTQLGLSSRISSTHRGSGKAAGSRSGTDIGVSNDQSNTASAIQRDTWSTGSGSERMTDRALPPSPQGNAQAELPDHSGEMGGDTTRSGYQITPSSITGVGKQQDVLAWPSGHPWTLHRKVSTEPAALRRVHFRVPRLGEAQRSGYKRPRAENGDVSGEGQMQKRARTEVNASRGMGSAGSQATSPSSSTGVQSAVPFGGPTSRNNESRADQANRNRIRPLQSDGPSAAEVVQLEHVGHPGASRRSSGSGPSVAWSFDESGSALWTRRNASRKSPNLARPAAAGQSLGACSSDGSITTMGVSPPPSGWQLGQAIPGGVQHRLDAASLMQSAKSAGTPPGGLMNGAARSMLSRAGGFDRIAVYHGSASAQQPAVPSFQPVPQPQAGSLHHPQYSHRAQRYSAMMTAGRSPTVTASRRSWDSGGPAMQASVRTQAGSSGPYGPDRHSGEAFSFDTSLQDAEIQPGGSSLAPRPATYLPEVDRLSAAAAQVIRVRQRMQSMATTSYENEQGGSEAASGELGQDTNTLGRSSQRGTRGIAPHQSMLGIQGSSGDHSGRSSQSAATVPPTVSSDHFRLARGGPPSLAARTTETVGGAQPPSIPNGTPVVEPASAVQNLAEVLRETLGPEVAASLAQQLADSSSVNESVGSAGNGARERRE